MAEHISTVFIPIVFVAFVLAIAKFTAKGWRRVAGLYPLRNEFTGQRWFFRSAEIADSSIGSLMIVGADLRGVLFSIVFPFSLFSPPVFVPWSDLSGAEHKGLLTRFVELKFAQAPEFENRISGRLADKVEGSSGGVWKYERASRRVFFEKDGA